MSKSFFIDKTPPIPPPYCDIALILRTINLIFTRTQRPRCPPLGSFHEKFTRKIGLKNITFNYNQTTVTIIKYRANTELFSNITLRKKTMVDICISLTISRCPPLPPCPHHSGRPRTNKRFSTLKWKTTFYEKTDSFSEDDPLK